MEKNLYDPKKWRNKFTYIHFRVSQPFPLNRIEYIYAITYRSIWLLGSSIYIYIYIYETICIEFDIVPIPYVQFFFQGIEVAKPREIIFIVKNNIKLKQLKKNTYICRSRCKLNRRAYMCILSIYLCTIYKCKL